jgi:lipoyl(octanoyl) transferase
VADAVAAPGDPAAAAALADGALRVEWHGRVAYRDGLALQRSRHRRVSAGLLPDTLLLLEHEPVITLGRACGHEHVLTAPEALRARGIEVVPTGRGGDVTYHGPGQLMGYFLCRLVGPERDVGRFVYRLEEVVLRTAADFGVRAERVPGLRGLWVGNDKLAAIGVRMVDWVSCHGLALNVRTDLAAFADIVPCGLHGRGVTSLERQVQGALPGLERVGEQLAAHAADVFDKSLDRAASLQLAPVPDEALGRDPLL